MCKFVTFFSSLPSQLLKFLEIKKNLAHIFARIHFGRWYGRLCSPSVLAKRFKILSYRSPARLTSNITFKVTTPGRSFMFC